MRDLNNRVTMLEEENDEQIDIEVLKGKSEIKIEDFIEVMKNVKVDITRKMVSQTDVSQLKEQMREIEATQDKILEKHQ